LAFVLVAVVARHQQDSRALAVLDGSDWDRNPAISRAVNRIRQPDKTVLLAVPLEIDFGDKAGLTASHRAFLCAKQDRGYSTKASWSRGASDPVVDAFGAARPPHGRHQSGASLEHQLSGNCARQWLATRTRDGCAPLSVHATLAEP
jgi:hypothetical protein